MEITKYSFSVKGDDRGSLVAIEASETIPFPIKRVYYIFGTTPGTVRGHHAHVSLQQILICLGGSCTIVLDDSCSRVEVALTRPDEGLYVGSMVWREMKDFSPGALLLVLASEHYEEADYIRNYDAFLKRAKEMTQLGR